MLAYIQELTNGDTNGVDHRVHIDGSQSNVDGEQADTVEGANNANAGLDAVKSNNYEGQAGKSPLNVQLFETAVAGISQQAPSSRELEYLSQTSLLKKKISKFAVL